MHKLWAEATSFFLSVEKVFCSAFIKLHWFTSLMNFYQWFLNPVNGSQVCSGEKSLNAYNKI